MITIEDLKDFDTWKKWKNGEVKLVQPELEQLSASWAKSREQTRETAMHIGFASGFMQEGDEGGVLKKFIAPARFLLAITGLASIGVATYSNLGAKPIVRENMGRAGY